MPVQGDNVHVNQMLLEERAIDVLPELLDSVHKDAKVFMTFETLFYEPFSSSNE